jgi:hypothetical protein
MMRWMRRWRPCLLFGQPKARRSRLAVVMTARRSGSHDPADTAAHLGGVDVAPNSPEVRHYSHQRWWWQRPAGRAASQGSQQWTALVPGLVAEAAAVEGEGSRSSALPQLGGGLVEVRVEVAAENHCCRDGRAGCLEG